MKINLKKLLVTGASLLIMTSVGAGVSNIKANASHYHFNNRYSNPFSRMLERKGWTSGPLSAFHHFRYNGHSFTLRTSSRAFQGEITSLDGNHHATNAQIVTALNGGNPYYHHYRKYYRRPVKKAKKHVIKRHIRKSHKVAKRRVSSKRTMVAERTYFKYEHAVHPKMAVKAINFSNVSWKQINNWNSQIKKVQTKRRNKRARKATVHKSRKNKTSRKVANFRKSAYYHKMWTSALKMNQKQVSHELKEATKYSKDGNMKASKKASQKANYFKRFVKHDQSMINLGK